MLKVQDGCNNFCSYCIIPYARGPVRSEPLETAVAQARELAAAGYREIVVTGIEIASWGWDLKNGQCLTDLLEALCAAVPDVRIRLLPEAVPLLQSLSSVPSESPIRQ